MRLRRLNRWQRVAIAGLVLAFGVAAVVWLRPSSEQSHRVVVASDSESAPSSDVDTTSIATTSTVFHVSGPTSTLAPNRGLPDHDAAAAPCDDCDGNDGFWAAFAAARAPQPGDFVGALTASHSWEVDGTPWDATVIAGQLVILTLEIRNISDHVIEVSRAGVPDLRIVCAADLTADGHTDADLLFDRNEIFVTNPPLRPGENGGAGPMGLPMTDADIGPMTCAGVIVANGRPIARLTNIPPVTFTVVAAPSTTTTPTTTASVGEQQRG